MAMNEGPGHLLKPRQIVLVAGLGLAFWLAAAMTVRYGAPAGWFGGAMGALTFALSAPAGWVTTWAMKRLAGLAPEQLVPGLALGTAAAAFCDGIALTWTPTLYGASAEHARLGAAWILWGVGCILLCAYAGSRGRASP